MTTEILYITLSPGLRIVIFCCKSDTLQVRECVAPAGERGEVRDEWVMLLGVNKGSESCW